MLWAGAILMALVVPGAAADQAAFAARAKAINGLVGYWSFEGNYEDQTGKGNHGVASGDLSKITFCPGVKGGQGVQITHTAPFEKNQGQLIAVPAPVGGVFDSPNVTVLVWARITSTGEQSLEDARSGWDNVFSRRSIFYIETQWVDQGDGTIALDSVNRIYDPENPNDGGTNQVRSLQSDTPVALKRDTWHLLGFTYDGQTFISYIDGKEAARLDYDLGIAPTENTPPASEEKGDYDLHWGPWDKQEDWPNGCFDDTVYYTRALTAEEVKSLFDAMMQ
jgi:hypothetical protein